MSALIPVIIAISVAVMWALAIEARAIRPSLADRATSPSNPPQDAALRTAAFLVVAVVAVLFALLFAAFGMTAAANELQFPPLLWFNTLALCASSVALSFAQENTRAPLGLALFLGTLFLAGQATLWKMLLAAGVVPGANATAAFFYLITGLHGVHLLAGLAIFVFLASRPAGCDAKSLWNKIRLCALYWSVLLVVWLIAFALLMGWGAGLAGICRAAFAGGK